jgi:hypothetical protein
VGRVTINGEPKGGVNLTVENLNNSVSDSCQTAYNQTGQTVGYYIGTVTGQNGNKIKVTCFYQDKTYIKNTTIDFSETNTYVNFSFTYNQSENTSDNTDNDTDDDTDDDEDGDSGSGGFVPPPPPDDGDDTNTSDNTSDDNETEDNTTDDTDDADNDTDDDIPDTSNQTENITLYIETTDDRNNSISTKVDIYDENQTLVKSVYTNSSGEATVQVPPGSYTIKSDYNGDTENKDMSFVNDGRITLTFSPENPEDVNLPTHEPSDGGINLIHIIAVILSAITITGVIIWWRKNSAWYW